MADWTEIGEIGMIPRCGALVVATSGGPVAIFRTGDDQLFAIDDRCPHRDGPLSEGIVHGHQVTCPLHGWVIDLGTGSAVAPDHGRIGCHAVKLEDGIVWLQRGASE